MTQPKRQEVATRDEQAQVPVTSEAGAILSMIERAAKDPAVDIDKMERLMRMRNDMIEREQERAFFEAMGRAQAKMPQVLRDAKNTQSNSTYARLETINKAITPVITEHGFSMSFGTEDSPKDGHYRVTCVVAHRDGYSREYHADLPSDTAGFKGNANKTLIQGFGSTVSYGRRYLTLLIFNVALTNEDDDGKAAGNSATITEEQAARIRELAETTGANLARLLRSGKIERLEDTPADAYDELVRALDEYGRRKGTIK